MKPTERHFIEGVTLRLHGDDLRVANLSVGGLFAATTRPPLRGQVVRLTLKLGDGQSHEVVGAVTWINDGPSPKAKDNELKRSREAGPRPDRPSGPPEAPRE